MGSDSRTGHPPRWDCTTTACDRRLPVCRALPDHYFVGLSFDRPLVPLTSFPSHAHDMSGTTHTWVPMGARVPVLSPNDHPNPSPGATQGFGKKSIFEISQVPKTQQFWGFWGGGGGGGGGARPGIAGHGGGVAGSAPPPRGSS